MALCMMSVQLACSSVQPGPGRVARYSASSCVGVARYSASRRVRASGPSVADVWRGRERTVGRACARAGCRWLSSPGPDLAMPCVPRRVLGAHLLAVVIVADSGRSRRASRGRARTPCEPVDAIDPVVDMAVVLVAGCPLGAHVLAVDKVADLAVPRVAGALGRFGRSRARARQHSCGLVETPRTS